MKSQINLVSKKEQRKSLGRFNIATMGIFGATFLAATGLLIYLLILNLQIAGLDRTREDLNSQITQLSSQKLNVLLLKERLASIQKVLSGRTDVNPKMQTVLSLLPSNVDVSSINTDSSHIVVRLTSTSLSDLNSILENNIGKFTEHPELGIKKIDLATFGVDTKAAQYFAELNFQFGGVATATVAR